MKPSLRDQLHRDNPWLEVPETFPSAAQPRVPRPFLQRIVPGTDSWPVQGKAHLVVGARQVGKSSWLWRRLLDGGQAPLFIDGESPSVRLWATAAATVAHDLAELTGPGTPILIDEAQHLDEAGLLVKGLVDRRLPNPLYVTGSSWFDLRSRTRESLAGRAVRAKVHPFSLRELAATLPQDLAPAPTRWGRRRLALRQAVVGGYPDVWLGENPDQLAGHLLDAIVLRDASDLYGVQRLRAFRRLLILVAAQQGSLVNLSEWASISEAGRDTIARWLDLLEEAHIVHRLPPFVGGRRAELTGRAKIYLCDPGLSAALIRRFEPFEDRDDRGRLLEAWVASELRKRFRPIVPERELMYWRSKGGAEVDFVLRGTDELVGIEVKATALSRPRLTRSSRSFIAAYAPQRFYVVHLGESFDDRIGDTAVCWRGPEVLAEPVI